MATFRADILINTQFGPPAGWSESMYFDSTLGIDDALLFYSNSDQISLRRQLLTPDFYVFAIRLTDALNLRVARIAYFNYASGMGMFPTPANAANSAEPFVALKVPFTFASGKTRVYHLRGIPNNVVGNTFAYLEGKNPQFDSTVVKWAGSLVTPAAPQTIIILEKKLLTPSPPIAIQTLAPALTNSQALAISVINNTTPPIVAGDMIRVTGVPNVAWVNKPWKVRVAAVSALTPPLFLMSTFPRKQTPVGTFPASVGFVIRQGFSYVPAITFDITSGTEKKVGRPFGVLHGRRSLQRG